VELAQRQIERRRRERLAALGTALRQAMWANEHQMREFVERLLADGDEERSERDDAWFAGKGVRVVRTRKSKSNG
jgi:hypothetical protein